MSIHNLVSTLFVVALATPGITSAATNPNERLVPCPHGAHYLGSPEIKQFCQAIKGAFQVTPQDFAESKDERVSPMRSYIVKLEMVNGSSCGLGPMISHLTAPTVQDLVNKLNEARQLTLNKEIQDLLSNESNLIKSLYESRKNLDLSEVE